MCSIIKMITTWDDNVDDDDVDTLLHMYRLTMNISWFYACFGLPDHINVWSFSALVVSMNEWMKRIQTAASRHRVKSLSVQKFLLVLHSILPLLFVALMLPHVVFRLCFTTELWYHMHHEAFQKWINMRISTTSLISCHCYASCR